MIWVRKTPAALGQTEYKSILLYSEVPNSTQEHAPRRGSCFPWGRMKSREQKSLTRAVRSRPELWEESTA